ncbi:MAG: hypothetical protein HOJ48_17700 [Desulfobacula sp.]|nr:hypothetical protein [Desulfobacula sp.]MBT7262004.1 hypothetical protein [Desulfobacula sp.]
MMPGLGKTYDIEIQVISKPISEYNTDEYFELDLPVAPAVLVGDEIVAEGTDVPGHDIEVSICKQLDLSAPQKKEKGFLGKLFKK